MSKDDFARSRLFQMLDDDEYFATVVQIQRSGHNLDAYGAVSGADSAGYLIQYENAPDLAATVYEGDAVSAWIAIYDEASGAIRGFGLGDDEAGYVRIAGFDDDDVDRGMRAAYNFWTDVELESGVWTAEFADDFRNNGASRQGIRIETGAEDRYTFDHGMISGNGSTDETVQTIRIEGWLENPWYDWSTDAGADLLSGIEFGVELTYVDYADALLVDGEDGGGGDETPVTEPDPDPEPVYGDNGRDRLIGTGEADWIWGLGGRDVIKGRGGDDLLSGGGGRDKLVGNGGADNLFGGNGADKLVGGRGADLLMGQGGRDKLIGGGGADWLQGDDGRDVLKGGGGSDSFVFDARDGRDKVLDWQEDRDWLIVSAGADGFADLEITDVRAGAKVHWAATTVILVGVEADALAADDFSFIG